MKKKTNTNRDKRVRPLLSRTGVPGWETGTTGVSQPGQINVFVVVVHVCFALRSLDRWRMLYAYPIQNVGYWSEQFQVFLSCTPGWSLEISIHQFASYFCDGV